MITMTDKDILLAIFLASAVAMLATMFLPVQHDGCPDTPTRMFWFCSGAGVVGGAGALAKLLGRIV